MSKEISSKNLSNIDALVNDFSQALYLNSSLINEIYDNINCDDGYCIDFAISVLADNIDIINAYMSALRELVDCIYESQDFRYSKKELLIAVINKSF